ncbi:hypothetical protein E2C01_068485 [Portunus trituberculatus]|uniref:Uncharacterized protein n=1 Tax=Portunus trituberculatus TaxID=210409 RepID=A0A5B7HWL2_PORTR|nr:hypothetical protein [Portunus trituberculatus]
MSYFFNPSSGSLKVEVPFAFCLKIPVGGPEERPISVAECLTEVIVSGMEAYIPHPFFSI